MIPPGLSIDGVRSRADLQRGAVAELLEDMLAAAATFCERHTGRTLSPSPAGTDDDPGGDRAAPVARTIRARENRFVRVPDLRRVASIELAGQPVTDFDLIRLQDRDDVPAHMVELSAGAERVTITGWWGFAVIPDDLTDAIYTDAARRAQQVNSGYPDAVDAGLGLRWMKSLPATVQTTYGLYDIRDRHGV